MRPVRTDRLALTLAVLLPVLTGCGGSNSPTSPMRTPTPVPRPTRAAITVTIAPDPVPPGAGGFGYPYSASFEVNVAETAGLGGNVDDITLSSGASKPLVLHPSDIIAAAGTNHIAARGRLTVPIAIYFSTTTGSSTSMANITVHFSDDNGNQLVGNAVVHVQ